MAGKAARFLEEESGTTAVEYALIASLIVVVLAAVLMQYTSELNGIYEFVRETFVGAVSNLE
jgi:Flp pilus assembly pilin Flp